MGLFFLGAFDDFLGGQPDAFVIDIHAAVAGTERDLFGAVGMAVEPGLADHELQPATQLVGHGIDCVTDVIQPFGLVGHAGGNACRSPVFAMHGAHLCGPFPGGDTGLGGGN